MASGIGEATGHPWRILLDHTPMRVRGPASYLAVFAGVRAPGGLIAAHCGQGGAPAFQWSPEERQTVRDVVIPSHFVEIGWSALLTRWAMSIKPSA